MALVLATPFRNETENRAIEKRSKQGLIRAIETVRNDNRQLGEYGPVAIDTYIHVVTTTEENQRSVTDDDLRAQMEALNDAYRPARMSFGLKDVTRVKDPAWSVGRDEDAMYRALHRGTRSTLNLYILEDLFRDDAGPNRIVRGESTYPDRSGDDTADDYVLVQSYTLPGRVNKGDPSKRNYGATAVHEVGHWLGLFHTFETAYGADLGDLVDDTPFETDTYIQLKFGEPFDDGNGDRRAICKSLEPDVPNNIGNFMNDAPDFCRYEFTNGQLLNVRRLWDYFRAPSPSDQQPPEGPEERQPPPPVEAPQPPTQFFAPAPVPTAPGNGPWPIPFNGPYGPVPGEAQTPVNAVEPLTTNLVIETPAPFAGEPDDSLALSPAVPTELARNNPQPPGQFPDGGVTGLYLPYLSQIHTFQYFVTGVGRGPSAGIVVDPRPMTMGVQNPLGGYVPRPLPLAAPGLAQPFSGSVTVTSSYPRPFPPSPAPSGDPEPNTEENGVPLIYSNPKFAGGAADPTPSSRSGVALPTGTETGPPTSQPSPANSPSGDVFPSGAYNSPMAGSGRFAVSVEGLAGAVLMAVYMAL
ncbi:hypothetical protein HIM_02113 [Hirsutella minnesotensis 3608]|nr:hypothetical protein HIM_02113 [Hirsutella minnesotensis 3608]